MRDNMKNIDIMQIDAFTDRPMSGNPAGLVLDANDMTEEEMQKIAREMNCSETAFVTRSQLADFKVRFFSPTTEVNLCGHATIAMFYALAKLGLVELSGEITTMTQETNVGVLRVHIHKGSAGDDPGPAGDIKIMMEQNPPTFQTPDVKPEEVADALNIR